MWSETAASLPPLPDVCHGYRVIRKLGQGGFGTVYEVQGTPPGLAVGRGRGRAAPGKRARQGRGRGRGRGAGSQRWAMKGVRLGQDPLTDDGREGLDTALVMELQTLVQHTRHPNLVHVHDLFFDCGASGELPDDPQAVYIIMDYAAGGDLKSWMTQHVAAGDVRQLAVMKEFGFYLQDALRGLRHLHSQELAHLDVKPANILLYPSSMFADESFMRPKERRAKRAPRSPKSPRVGSSDEEEGNTSSQDSQDFDEDDSVPSPRLRRVPGGLPSSFSSTTGEHQRAKLSDYGISSWARARAYTVGTIVYIAPELLGLEKLMPDAPERMELDLRRADIWSVGILIVNFLMASGEDDFVWQQYLKDGPGGSADLDWALLASNLKIQIQFGFNSTGVPDGGINSDVVEGMRRSLWEMARSCLQINPFGRPTVSELLDHDFFARLRAADLCLPARMLQEREAEWLGSETVRIGPGRVASPVALRAGRGGRGNGRISPPARRPRPARPVASGSGSGSSSPVGSPTMPIAMSDAGLSQIMSDLAAVRISPAMAASPVTLRARRGGTRDRGRGHGRGRVAGSARPLSSNTMPMPIPMMGGAGLYQIITKLAGGAGVLDASLIPTVALAMWIGLRYLAATPPSEWPGAVKGQAQAVIGAKRLALAVACLNLAFKQLQRSSFEAGRFLLPPGELQVAEIRVLERIRFQAYVWTGWYRQSRDLRALEHVWCLEGQRTSGR